jgi:hypothetical protein
VAALQSCGIILPGVNAAQAGTQLERGDARRQEIEHHHQCQAILC